jgi:tyrosyl-tRNA synthetase
MQDIFEDLKFRGLIYQVTNEKRLKEKLKKEKIVLYCGFDPTAPSLHLGNLVPLLTLRRFQIFGHKPIALIGGGTALIGDPSGKTKERILNPIEKIKEWKEKLKKQLERFLDFETEKNPAKILDNFEWLSKIDLISFLRDYGKNFQVSQMISKEWVKERLKTTGISFCEFSYMILQAIDFLKLYEMENCQLQIGGSDQWGNIVCGVELIKKIKGAEVFGFTLPLLLTKSGKKFGKTEMGTIFLDKNLTPVYQFYQYLINIDDRDVIQLLKYFTFLCKEEIEGIEKEMKEKPKERKAQKILARELTKMVHGKEELKRVERISQLLFYGKIRELKEEEIQEALFDVPTKVISLEKEISILDLLKEGGVTKSKAEAKRLIQQRGVQVNEELIESIERKFSRKDSLYNKYFVIKKGKRNYFLVKVYNE